MRISDTFLIENPYGPFDVRHAEGGSGDLEQMKRVVDMERQKITLRMAKDSLDESMSSRRRSRGHGDLPGELG